MSRLAAPSLPRAVELALPAATIAVAAVWNGAGGAVATVLVWSIVLLVLELAGDGNRR